MLFLFKNAFVVLCGHWLKSPPPPLAPMTILVSLVSSIQMLVFNTKIIPFLENIMKGEETKEIINAIFAFVILVSIRCLLLYFVVYKIYHT